MRKEEKGEKKKGIQAEIKKAEIQKRKNTQS